MALAIGMKSQTVLITGASSGIGLELSKLFASDKWNLVLVARNAAKLEQISGELQAQHGTSVRTYSLDLTESTAADRLFREVRKSGLQIDALVNNAGFGKFGKFQNVALEESLGQVQLNVTSLTHLTKLFLGPMLERGSGKIMNVASTAAFQPGPLMAVYYATKAYVLSFSEALANELRGTGVTVTCFCPGATDTNFQKRAGLEDSRLFKQIGAMDVKTVARDGYRAFIEGKPLVISGLRNWILAESVRFSPRRLVTSVSRWVQEKV